MVPPGHPSYTLKRVWLTKAQVNNYYHGYSNHVLWPLCHMSLDKIYFMRRFWEDYTKVNRAFASAALEEADDDTIVWVHDYQLCLVPKFLREKKPGLTIAHFWHIPWPNWGVFRVCPQPKKIIEGLLANDLIGFQIPLFVKNFLDCAHECLGSEGAHVDYELSTVHYKGHTTKLKAFPISVDFDRFNEAASTKRTVTAIKNLKNKYKIVGQTGVGVDRLEYTKGLIKRLQAIELFFEKYERFRGSFTVIQVAVPTREKEPYLSYKKLVEEHVERINRKYSSGYWSPIIYIDRKIDHKDLVAYYRMADVGIVSSVYDGMNLVAKEYVASQVDEKGMLILSELAGAAEELEGSIIVNPYNIEDFADAIRRALVMQEREKSLRMAVLRKHVKEYDIYRWISEVLTEILSVSTAKVKRCRYILNCMDEVHERVKGDGTLLFLDYDGTLTPIVSTPEKALIKDSMRSLIKRLNSRIPVAIISGRSLTDIKELVGIEGLIYAGNHGAEIWDGKETVVSQNITADRYLLNELLQRLSNELARFSGVFVEDKGATASIHYRLLKVKELAEFFEIFERTVADYEDSFRITSGKKVFEIRPLALWNKGDAVKWISENLAPGRDVVYIGDDTTDEDAFKVIKGHGASIAIVSNPEADYYLKSQSELQGFLEQIARHLEGR
jgi:trehalose 6-phosphate synthase/phosphatase